MKIVRTLSLSPKQAIEIHSLVSLCRRADGIILSCPEDGDEFWLLYEQDKTDCVLAAFFAVYKMEEDVWECYVFTRPDCRGHGYCSALLDKVCEDSQAAGEPDLWLITDNRCQSALDVLHHLEAEFIYDEYMMELELDRWAASEKPGGPETFSSLSLRTSSDGSLDGQMTVTAWPSNHDANIMKTGYLPSASSPAGSCRIRVQGEHAYLYSLEIHPSLRRQGLGTSFLRALIPMLKEQGCRCLSLQVSGTNVPALGLYQKTGFHITETLSYYLY